MCQPKTQYPEALVTKTHTDIIMDALFSMENKAHSPGKDKICYLKLKNIGMKVLKKLLC